MKRLLLLIFFLVSLESFSQSSEYASIIQSDGDTYVPMSDTSAVPACCLKFISLVAPGVSAADIKHWSAGNSSRRIKCEVYPYLFLFDSEGNNLEILEVLDGSDPHSLYYDVDLALNKLGYFENFDNVVFCEQGVKKWYEASYNKGVLKINWNLDALIE